MNDKILSPSAVKLYLSCNYAYYLRYFEKCEPIQTDDTPLRLGKSVHKILEKFYENLDITTKEPDKDFMEKLRQTAFNYWDRTIDSNKREEIEPYFYSWLNYELQKFSNYKRQGCTDRFLPIAVEEDITDYQNKIRAVVDKRCIGISGIQYAIDYKTNKKLPAARNFEGQLHKIDMDFKVQAALNAQVLKANGHNIGSFFYQFIRFPDKLLSVPLTPTLFTEVDQLITTIRNDTTFERNPKGCFFCNFKIYCTMKSRSVHCL